MAQRPTRGTAPVQKPNPVPHEEDAAPRSQEKPQGQGTIAVVKSKIREKDASRQEEETLPGTKVTTSKINSRPKRHRTSPDEYVKDDPAIIQKSDIKSEKIDVKPEVDNAKSEVDVKPEVESKLEENQTALLPEAKSKKSIAKVVQSRKSLGPTEDEQTEGVQPKKSDIKREAESFVTTDPALPKTVSSAPDPPERNPESQNIMKDIQSDFPQNVAKKSFAKPLPPQKIERKNYLANLSPEPLDEYPTDEEESKDQEKASKRQDPSS